MPSKNFTHTYTSYSIFLIFIHGITRSTINLHPIECRYTKFHLYSCLSHHIFQKPVIKQNIRGTYVEAITSSHSTQLDNYGIRNSAEILKPSQSCQIVSKVLSRFTEITEAQPERRFIVAESHPKLLTIVTMARQSDNRCPPH